MEGTREKLTNSSAQFTLTQFIFLNVRQNNNKSNYNTEKVNRSMQIRFNSNYNRILFNTVRFSYLIFLKCSKKCLAEETRGLLEIFPLIQPRQQTHMIKNRKKKKY